MYLKSLLDQPLIYAQSALDEFFALPNVTLQLQEIFGRGAIHFHRELLASTPPIVITGMIPDDLVSPVATLMPYDLLALEYMYGKIIRENEGNTSYQFKEVYNYEIGTTPAGFIPPRKLTLQD